MMRKGVYLLCVLGACRSAPPASPAQAEVNPQLVASQQPCALGLSVGAEVQGVIPQLDGGVVDLVQLRGGMTIVEVSASWEPSFVTHEQWYRTHGHQARRSTFVLVAVDDRVEAIERVANVGRGYTLGWDPQGAMAIRWGVRELPLLAVVGPEGTLLEVWCGEQVRGEAFLATKLAPLLD